jgi:hypothetical protein
MACAFWTSSTLYRCASSCSGALRIEAFHSGPTTPGWLLHTPACSCCGLPIPRSTKCHVANTGSRSIRSGIAGIRRWPTARLDGAILRVEPRHARSVLFGRKLCAGFPFYCVARRTRARRRSRLHWTTECAAVDVAASVLDFRKARGCDAKTIGELSNTVDPVRHAEPVAAASSVLAAESRSRRSPIACASAAEVAQ